MFNDEADFDDEACVDGDSLELPDPYPYHYYPDNYGYNYEYNYEFNNPGSYNYEFNNPRLSYPYPPYNSYPNNAGDEGVTSDNYDLYTNLLISAIHVGGWPEEEIQTLLREGADANVALPHAIKNNSPLGIIRALFDAGAEVERLQDPAIQYKATKLFAEIEQKILIEAESFRKLFSPYYDRKIAEAVNNSVSVVEEFLGSKPRKKPTC